MSESDKNKTLIGKQVKIFHGNFKYEGILLEEDVYCFTIEDRKIGIIKLPRSSCMLQEVRE